MKKYLALALAVVLLAVGLTSCATGLGDQSAIDNYAPDVDYLITDDGTFYFKEIEGGAAALVNYIGKATKEDRVTVPAAFNDRVVTEIGAEAFYNITALVEVTLPDTIVKIDKYAFAGCSELTAINLPDGALTVEEYAFANCTKLATVDLGESLVSIGNRAFWSCTALAAIDLPDTLTTIGEGAFWKCTGLTALEIPTSVKAIGNLAYYDCTGLESIKLHDGIETLGEFIFVTDGSTLKDKIDLSNLTEDSKVRKYVDAMADPAKVEADTTADTAA